MPLPASGLLSKGLRLGRQRAGKRCRWVRVVPGIDLALNGGLIVAFHLLAFTGNNAASQTNLDTPGVYDGFAPLQNNHYIYPENARIAFGYGQGTNLARARVNTPFLRQVSLPYLTPIEVAAAVADDPAVVRFGQFGPYIPRLDEIGIDATTDASGTARDTVGLWLHDGNYTIPQGINGTTLRGTAAIVSTTLVWGGGVITFDQTLPFGRYSVIGMDVVGANCIFGRLIPAQAGKRPGVLARSALTINPPWDFRRGLMGEFCQFESTSPPSLEIFTIGAGSTQEVYLDVVKIS